MLLPVLIVACSLLRPLPAAADPAPPTVFRDIPYVPNADPQQRLDISVPSGSGPFPIAILVHGGGWSSGDKATDITPLFAPLNQAGLIWVSVNYRLAPQHRWPDCLNDVEDAIRWVKAHAATYHGDPGRIGLVGYSAGAHLTCLIAALDPPGTAVQALVGLAAPTDLVADTARRGGLSPSLQGLLGQHGTAVDAATEAQLARMSPLDFVHRGMPPCLLVQGTADKSVLFSQSISFQARLKSVGVPCRLIAIPGAPHNINRWTALDPDYPTQVSGWLQQTLAASAMAAAPMPHPKYESDGPADVTVAQDGSGDYRTIQEAIAAAPTGTPDHPSIIHVKPGTYHELLYMQREKRYVELIGTDPATTIVTFDLSANDKGLDGLPIGTFRTATADIDADLFTIKNITIANTAGPVGQALAVRIDGDRDVFDHCRFLGWQDTVFTNRGRQYFHDCTITGAVDFIFGGGTAYFDHCTIEELRDNGGDLTAPSTPADQPYGLIFSHCDITAAPNVQPGSTGLMRPWRAHGESVFLDCTMPPAIKVSGWDTWSGREKTCHAEEYGSRTPDGKRINLAARAPWVQRLTAAQAATYTLPHVFSGWDPTLPSP